jgi:hypothetical protein
VLSVFDIYRNLTILSSWSARIKLLFSPKADQAVLAREGFKTGFSRSS